MSEQPIEQIQDNWRDRPIMTPEKQQDFNYLTLIIMIVGIGSIVGFMIFNRQDYVLNIFTNILSVIFTVGIIDWLNKRLARQLYKHQLLLDMGSTFNVVALEALRKLWYEGYVESGELKNREFSQANLKKAFLSGVSLQGSSLIAANLSHADLTNVNLENCFLSWAKLSHSTMLVANMTGVKASLAIFEGADLQYADLSNAELKGANFHKAILNHSNLFGADLSYANLSGANLIRANLFNATITEETIFDSETILPDGNTWKESTDLSLLTNPIDKKPWIPNDDAIPWWAEGGSPRPYLPWVRTFFVPD